MPKAICYNVDMPNSPIILRSSTLVEGLVVYVDGYPGRQHKLTTATGGEPLEDGRMVTDHAVAEPRTLALTGIVSDFRGGTRPIEAWQQIEAMHQMEEAVFVITEWGFYPEMIISRCVGTATGRGQRFEMDLKEIIRVSTASIPIVPSTAMAGPAAEREAVYVRGRRPLGTQGLLPRVLDPAFGSEFARAITNQGLLPSELARARR